MEADSELSTTMELWRMAESGDPLVISFYSLSGDTSSLSRTVTGPRSRPGHC